VSDSLGAATSIFAITAAAASVQLDANRHGVASFTVTNTTATALRGRARIVPLTAAAAPWLTLGGDAERDFAPGATQQYAVDVKVPPDAAPGSYSFRLDAVGVANPDEQYTQGPSVAFAVAPQPGPVETKKQPFPWWIIAVAIAAVLVIAGGVTAFVLLRNVTVPTVVGESLVDAQGTLVSASLHVGATAEATSSSTPSTILQQNPGGGTPAPRNSGVDLVLAVPLPTSTPTQVPTATPVPPRLVTTAVIGSTQLSAGSSGTVAVTCPSGTVATGGGVDLGNVFTEKVTSSSPTFGGTRLISLPDGNGPAPNGWRASAVNNDPAVQTLKVAVMCGTGSSLSTVLSSAFAPANTFSSVRVTCPGGTMAIGGGVDVADFANMIVTASAPTFAANNNRLIFQPDGPALGPIGWQVAVLNQTGAAQPFKAAAICIPVASFGAVVGSGNAAAGSFAAVRVACPSGLVVTGGGTDLENVLTMKVTSSGPTFAANSSRLIFQPDGAAQPPIGWQASTLNNDPAAQPFKIAAICAPA
jgi:hypothetical protein